MTTKEFFKKTFNLTAIVYTIASAIIVLGALLAGADGSGMMKVTDVKTHLFLFLFSFASAISNTISNSKSVPSSAKYFVECGGMTLSFLLFVVLPKNNMKFSTAIGWIFGFVCAYVLVRVVISILKYDEKSMSKKVKVANKKAKKSHNSTPTNKNKKAEEEYTSLFSSNNK